MASRAHVMHDYGLGRASERPRREVWYRSSEDPIEIPRGSSSSGSSLGVVISAVIASSVILGAAYAIYVGPPPAMGRTAEQPLSSSWQLDPQPQRASVEKVLRGQVQAVPMLEPVATTEQQQADSSVPDAAPAPSNPPAATSSPETTIDDRYPVPQPAPPMPEPQVYPDPIKTPADAVGPELDLTKPTPGLDPENPYRD